MNLSDEEVNMAFSSYYRLLINYSDFVERSQQTFANMERNLFTMITQSNQERPLINNTPNNNVDPLLNTRFTRRVNARRRPYTPSQNVLDTITFLTLFPNGFPNNTTNLENMTPVIVRPTENQINLATDQMLFCNVENPQNVSCPIAQENFTPDDDVLIIRHCGHVFKNDSLRNWFQHSVRCPICRYDIREYRRGGESISRQNSSTTINTGTPPLNNELNEQTNNFLNTINQNLANVLSSTDISDNININFEVSHFPINSDPSSNIF